VAATSYVPQTYALYFWPIVCLKPSHNSPEFPHSWTLDDTRKDDEEDADSGSEAENDDEPQHAVKAAIPSSPPPSQAYLEFLQFLQLGCSGSPLQGYPTVVITLSTIPSSVRRLI